MPTIEVSLTLEELKAVIKSLSIGCDQLTKKIDRADSKGQTGRADETRDEFLVLMSAKHEMESVLLAAMK